MDVDAKNRPAYLKVLHWFRVAGRSRTKGPIPYVLKLPKLDDPEWAKNATPITPAQKRNLFSKLKSSETTCDDLLREMEDQGFRITKADLNRWMKLLEKQGQTQKVLEIRCFMYWKRLGLLGRKSERFWRHGAKSHKERTSSPRDPIARYTRRWQCGAMALGARR